MGDRSIIVFLYCFSRKTSGPNLSIDAINPFSPISVVLFFSPPAVQVNAQNTSMDIKRIGDIFLISDLAADLQDYALECFLNFSINEKKNKEVSQKRNLIIICRKNLLTDL